MRFYASAEDFKVGGNLRCGVLEARGRVICDRDISASESIRANRSIVAKGTISARWRIMAGLKSQPKYEEIVCAAVRQGRVYAGTLRLRPLARGSGS